MQPSSKKNNLKKNQRIKFIIIACLVSLIALSFVIANFRDNIVFFYSPNEISNPDFLPKINHRKIIRVGGMVKEGSIKYLKGNVLEFVITDFKNDLTIHYSGIKPDLFREKQGTIAKGFVNIDQNIFIASELLTKHDEKYMPPEVAKAIKKNY